MHIRTAALDLEEFRGPCQPRETRIGQVAEADVLVARQFYRFAADPTLGAPFADGDVWSGIEDGLEATSLDVSERGDLAAWRMDASYAERSGPFSPLDTLAGSGGYYALVKGVAQTCLGGNDETPPGLKGLRAISFIAPDDVTSSCLEWWAVTLFLDSQNRIKGVALRLGSP